MNGLLRNRHGKILRFLFALLMLPAPLLVGYDLSLQWLNPSVAVPSLVLSMIIVIAFWVSGDLILLKFYHHPAARLLFLSAQVVAIALLGPLTYPDFWKAPALIGSFSIACADLIGPFALHACLSFPPQIAKPRLRTIILLIVYGAALAAIVFGVSHSVWAVRLSTGFSALALAVALGMLVFVYYRRAAPDARRRLRVAFFSTFLAAVPTNLLYILPPVFGASARIPPWTAGFFLILAPAGYIYAILHHNPLGLDRFINRAMVYVILSTGILLLYLGPMLVITTALSGDVLAEALLVVILLIVVGISFGWSRDHVQRWVDRTFYGGWYDYPAVVESISDALARSLDRWTLTDVLTHQVVFKMKLRGAMLWLDQPGEPAEGQYCYDFQAGKPARWVIGPRLDGDELSDSDLRILRTLARQAEIALSNVLLVERLRRQLDEIGASRQALAQAQHQLLRSREEERARLARDLHDGPIQELVGLNLQLGLLLAQPEAAALEAALKEMRTEVQTLLENLRQVCADLRPPMLDTLGLGAALRALAEDWQAQTDTELRLELPQDASLRRLPGEAAVNLYRIAQATLANIARHSQARQAAITLTVQGEWVSMVICDDGKGFELPPSFQDLTSAGHFGLVGMQERAALIGGKLEIESAPGKGTIVRVLTH